MDPSPKKLHLTIPGLHQEGTQIMRLSGQSVAWSQTSVPGGLLLWLVVGPG